MILKFCDFFIFFLGGGGCKKYWPQIDFIVDG